MEQIAKVLSEQAGSKKKPKRKVSYVAKTTSEDSNSSSDESQSYFYFNFGATRSDSYTSASATQNVSTEFTNYALRNIARRKTARSKFTTELVIELLGPGDLVKPLRCLLDTGTSKSILLAHYTNMCAKVTKAKHPIEWKTLTGTLVTEKIGEINFKIPELSTSKQISWKLHLDEVSNHKQVPYDIILGLDLLTELEMVLDFGTKTIKWGENEMEMLPPGTITDEQRFNMLYQSTQEPSVLQEAEERQSRILDANYAKVEMETYVATLTFLSNWESVKA